MAVKKKFGTLVFDDENDAFVITELQPHVCIKLKAIFNRIPKQRTVPFHIQKTAENCADLHWFMERYPLTLTYEATIAIVNGVTQHKATTDRMEEIMLTDYTKHDVTLRGEHKPRPYQIQASELHARAKRLLLGDDLGLGKTLSAILTLLDPTKLPAIVVVQTHLPRQWQAEIDKFTSLTTHIIKGTQPYSLPVADVYIIKYSCLVGWVDLFNKGYFKSLIFDEVQELRRQGSKKYSAAMTLASGVDYCLGLSATPVYNFGDEIFSVMKIIKDGALGSFDEFITEWGRPYGMNRYIIKDPAALGTYLRDNYFMLRRTRAEVGRELPPINKIVHTVGYDNAEVEKSEDLARTLAMRVMHGSFVERGSAARDLDILVRQSTGVSKAREVAEYVKILLENNEPVVLAGWHREVYDIWREALAEFNPVFYTGTESETQKIKSKEAFINGETNLFIISLRSGIGLDGLQKRCKVVVIGELDWSPKVHDQLIARVDRDGQQEQVTAIYLVSEYGSDPVIIDLLGLKSSQAHGIVDPLTAPVQNVSDDSRMKKLAQQFLYGKRSN